jgi:hypothetical protein
MNTSYAEYVSVYAKPSAKNVSPYHIFVQPLALSALQNATIDLIGRSFWNIQNVYLSASDPNIFQGNASFFNPFSTTTNLYPTNPGFYAIVIPVFTLANGNNIIFEIPEYIFYYINQKNTNYSCYLDIIVENQAGYGLLSRDSIQYPISSWQGFTFSQNPCISGIYVSNY